MMETRITIGIQARSTSTRLPNKINEMIGPKTMLSHVVSSCAAAKKYLHKKNSHIDVNVAILIPYGDPIKTNNFHNIHILEGHEHDVLSRYSDACHYFKSDYMVRITSDCPLIPPYIISNTVFLAMNNDYDYISNVDPRCRTSIDGYDCEVLSKKAMNFLETHAREPFDLEHVTTLLRSSYETSLRLASIQNHLNLSDRKLSVDTIEDLNLVRQEYERANQSLDIARDIYGRDNVHMV